MNLSDMTSRAFCILVAIIILFINTPAQEKLVLNGDNNEYALTPYLSVFEDKACLLTIQDMLTPQISYQFKPASNKTLNPGITNSAWWVRVEIVDSTVNGNRWILQVNYPGIDKVDLFIVDTSQRIVSKHGGALLPFNQREIRDRRTVFSIRSQGLTSQTMYVRFESQSSVALYLRLMSLQRYMVADHNAQFYLGVFYGSILILILYNLFLFLAIRDLSYLFYVLYAAGYVFHQIVVDGLYEEYFFPTSIVESVYVFQMAIGFFFVFGSLFTQRILFSSRFSPLLHKGLTVCAILGGMVFVLAPTVSGQLMNRLLSLILIPYVFLALAMAIVGLQNRFTPARFYLLAVMGFVIGLIIRGLRVSGFLPLNLFTEYIFQAGMLWEMTLFSFALGDRINTIKLEKEMEKGQMRRRIAGDLHDEIGSNLSSISMTSQMVQQSTKLNKRERNRLADISTIAKETTEAIRDIVWFINPEHDKLVDLVLRLKDVTPKLLAGIDYAFITSGHTIETMPDLLMRKEVYLFYKEALNNIVKHAKASKVDIEIRSESDKFVIIICDNGIGFEVGNVKEGFGLKNLRDRATKIGAKLDLSSCTGQGVKITLAVPT
jgi:signal transduction histidine kinase